MLSVLQEAQLPKVMNTPLDGLIIVSFSTGRGEVGRRRGRGKGMEEGGGERGPGGEGDEAEKWEREGEVYRRWSVVYLRAGCRHAV